LSSRPALNPEPRIPLNRDRVLRAAITLADESGLETVTMRKLGQALGVEAMSLYNHVANKDDLLTGMVDQVVAEMEVAAVDGDWKAAIRRSVISAHDVLVAHPWAARLMISSPGVSTARLRYMEGLLAALRHGGFSAVQTHHAYHALDSHIVGFTLWQVSFPFEAEELPDLASRFLRQLPADEYPALIEHVELHLAGVDDDGESEFAYGLDLILDGVERLRDSA
jgi:AcrR family transcriptional regulator